MNRRVGYSWMTPAPMGPSGSGGSGAISIVQLFGGPAELDDALTRVGVGTLAVGQVRLRRICSIDTGLAIRWAANIAQLTLHAGAAVTRAIDSALRELGLEPTEPGALDPRLVYPEAADLIEACVLSELSRCASPLAVDVLLGQRAAWRASAPVVDPATGAALNRLLHPPTVVAIGPANVGKSTLVNALAGRTVSIVADEPGTTRDHVGVSLEVAGLAIRWIDAPGWRWDAQGVEREAIALASRAAASADLIVSCADNSAEFVDVAVMSVPESTPVLRVATRADLGRRADAEVVTAAQSGLGLTDLAASLRRHLVPDEALSARGRWRFHPALAQTPN